MNGVRYLGWDGSYLPKSGVGARVRVLARRQHSHDETLGLWKRVDIFEVRALRWDPWPEARFIKNQETISHPEEGLCDITTTTSRDNWPKVCDR
jgi:hypothetical protein